MSKPPISIPKEDILAKATGIIKDAWEFKPHFWPSEGAYRYKVGDVEAILCHVNDGYKALVMLRETTVICIKKVKETTMPGLCGVLCALGRSVDDLAAALKSLKERI